MILNLTDLSDEPLQSQIIRQVRAKVLSGSLSAGDPLPSIRKLASSQKISVITVQRAYEALEREGLIHSRRGKGFFASEINSDAKKEMTQNRIQEKMAPIIQNALAEGMTINEIETLVKELLKSLKG